MFSVLLCFWLASIPLRYLWYFSFCHTMRYLLYLHFHHSTFCCFTHLFSCPVFVTLWTIPHCSCDRILVQSPTHQVCIPPHKQLGAFLHLYLPNKRHCNGLASTAALLKFPNPSVLMEPGSRPLLPCSWDYSLSTLTPWGWLCFTHITTPKSRWKTAGF